MAVGPVVIVEVEPARRAARRADPLLWCFGVGRAVGQSAVKLFGFAGGLQPTGQVKSGLTSSSSSMAADAVDCSTPC